LTQASSCHHLLAQLFVPFGDYPVAPCQSLICLLKKAFQLSGSVGAMKIMLLELSLLNVGPAFPMFGTPAGFSHVCVPSLNVVLGFRHHAISPLFH
jgi:hypothetical protein